MAFLFMRSIYHAAMSRIEMQYRSELHLHPGLAPTKAWLKSPAGKRGGTMFIRTTKAVHKKTTTSTHSANLGLSWFSSVLKQIQGFKLKVTFPNHEGLQPKSMPTFLGLNPPHKGQFPTWWWGQVWMVLETSASSYHFRRLMARENVFFIRKLSSFTGKQQYKSFCHKLCAVKG